MAEELRLVYQQGDHVCTSYSSPEELYRSHRALGLCLYRRTMPPEFLDHCLATHAVVRVDGPLLLTNPFYELPEDAMIRKPRTEHVERKLQHFHSA